MECENFIKEMLTEEQESGQEIAFHEESFKMDENKILNRDKHQDQEKHQEQ